MKKIIFLTIATAVLSACAPYGVKDASVDRRVELHTVGVKAGFYSSTCRKEVRGGSDAKFWYGDSYLNAKPKSNVGKNTEYTIELKPDSGYEHSDVTTKCVSSTPVGTDCTWLDKTQKESASKYMIFCVPDDVPLGATFKFEISVPTIGELDPRIEVTW